MRLLNSMKGGGKLWKKAAKWRKDYFVIICYFGSLL